MGKRITTDFWLDETATGEPLKNETTVSYLIMRAKSSLI